MTKELNRCVVEGLELYPATRYIVMAFVRAGQASEFQTGYVRTGLGSARKGIPWLLALMKR